MNSNATEVLIDVRPMPPRDRHPTIFNTWERLNAGEAILLVNDHDPVPLYYQFACENAGSFHWEYLDKGPDLYRVRITKGEFENPGFVPAAKTVHKCSSPVAAGPFVLDTRPLFARGETPCGAIDDAVAALAPGQPLVLLVPFEPVPLYAKLSKQGFNHNPRQDPDGTWRVEFNKS